MNTYSETKMFDMVKSMLENKNIAVVSDAGMPCISDPGWRMVRMVREALPNVPI
jgi:16S rRNA (cytidine1402-2'-O)-methyltransferase